VFSLLCLSRSWFVIFCCCSIRSSRIFCFCIWFVYRALPCLFTCPLTGCFSFALLAPTSLSSGIFCAITFYDLCFVFLLFVVSLYLHFSLAFALHKK
jgi:hypothetical protein